MKKLEERLPPYSRRNFISYLVAQENKLFLVLEPKDFSAQKISFYIYIYSKSSLNTHGKLKTSEFIFLINGWFLRSGKHTYD